MYKLFIMIFMITSCTSVEKPFTEVRTATAFIHGYKGLAEDLNLLISDNMNDSMGINMTIITDSILNKGFLPDGFEQKNGFRIYKYTDANKE